LDTYLISIPASKKQLESLVRTNQHLLSKLPFDCPNAVKDKIELELKQAKTRLLIGAYNKE
jgi:hypothetical protein